MLKRKRTYLLYLAILLMTTLCFRLNGQPVLDSIPFTSKEDTAMNKTIYIFSGLGADGRAFQKIDFSGYSVNYIEWQTPNKNETLEKYASRLLRQIKVKKPILIGFSFGGIMAIEVAKQIETEKVIIISSVKNKNEIPFYFRITRQLGVFNLMPSAIIKKPNYITNWLFGASTTFEKKTLNQILLDTDLKLFKWAIAHVANWKNNTELKNIKHIHGTSDKMFPYFFISNPIKVTKGEHLMTLSRSEELTKILRELINE